MRGRWITPSASPPAGSIYKLIRLPDNVDWQAPFWGAVDELRKASNWEQLSGISADDTANNFLDLYTEWRMPNPLIGTIFAHASSTAPTNSLPCDGSTYNRSDYPDLYDRLDAAYRVGSTQLITPDLRGRTLVGDGTGTGLSNRAFAATFGAETHALSVAEGPLHTHTYVIVTAFPTPVTVGPVPNNSAGGAGAATGASGTGAAHNNKQPSLAPHYAIWAR